MPIAMERIDLGTGFELQIYHDDIVWQVWLARKVGRVCLAAGETKDDALKKAALIVQAVSSSIALAELTEPDRPK